jgi:AhpD family alkylhydroperoxidase
MTKLIEYEDSSDEVRVVYDDIRATRQTDEINNFWKALANHPPTLQRTWQSVKEVMTSPGELDPLVRELIYIAVSVTNGCEYCIASHTAAASAKGMSETMFGELMAIAATANMTNRLANGYRIPVDEKFKT